MRRRYFYYFIVVYGIVATAYGGFSLIYNLSNGKGVSTYALVLLISGVIALLFYLTLYAFSKLASKKTVNEPAPVTEENVVEEVVEAPVEEQAQEEEVADSAPQDNPPPSEDKEEKDDYVPRTPRSYRSSSSYSVSTIYVKQVGYGPLLRVEGNRILDMRNSTYYRIENNMVMQEGYGPVYEIRGNQIKDAFGGYLYEISGSNINKVFGGFYASISGNYITLYDLSIKYEMSDSLSKRQILVVVTLLFAK